MRDSRLQHVRLQQGGTVLNLNYEYGNATRNDGRVKKINDLVVPDRTVHFEYDGLSRLKRAHTTGGATYPAWELTWSYSAAGNREEQTAVIGNPPASSLAFDPATNRVTSTGWSHDATGNVTATSDGSFSIDAAGRTIGHTPASGPALGFAFDATGLRTRRTDGASTTLYLRDGGQVIGEWNGTSWSKEYVWLGSTLLATIEGSTIKYHHADHLSIRATTFADGMVGEEQGHYPFGEPWYETSPETTRIFTTYDREAGGSLDYAMFRWMGPEAGRFLSPDLVPGSFGNGQSWNRYAYAWNDPVNFWDPEGLKPHPLRPEPTNPFWARDMQTGAFIGDGVDTPLYYYVSDPSLAFGGASPSDHWWVFAGWQPGGECENVAKQPWPKVPYIHTVQVCPADVPVFEPLEPPLDSTFLWVWSKETGRSGSVAVPEGGELDSRYTEIATLESGLGWMQFMRPAQQALRFLRRNVAGPIRGGSNTHTGVQLFHGRFKFMTHAGHRGPHGVPHHQIEAFGYRFRHEIGTPWYRWTRGPL